jgi:peptide deformylase
MNTQLSLLQIRIYGDDKLKAVSQPVTEFDDKLHKLVADMTHTMYLRDGVGLAANQVGHAIRLIVIDSDWSRDGEDKNPVVMLNPVLLTSEGEYESEEGCLSLPDVYAKVKRFNKITYKYTDLQGKEHLEAAEGFKAVIIQHEYDHLNGMLFVDRISKLSLIKVKRKLGAILKTAVDGVNIRTHEPETHVKM